MDWYVQRPGYCVDPLVGAGSLYMKLDCYTKEDDAEEATALC